jgi:hypothetical protein
MQFTDEQIRALLPDPARQDCPWNRERPDHWVEGGVARTSMERFQRLGRYVPKDLADRP